MVEKVSIEVTKKALKEYEKKRIVIPPEEIELDEEQEWFLQGYICGKSGQKETAEEGEGDIRRQILQIRSKYCEPILEILAQEGELYHGDLAERLEIAPSGLNAVIKKMLDCSPPIIGLMEIGKYKIYTLPPRMKNYMMNRSGDSKYGEASKWEGEEGENLFLCLQHFIEAAGIQWKDRLNLLLQEKQQEKDKKVKDKFQTLMKAAMYAFQYDLDAVRELRRFLNNDVLVYLLERYLEIEKEADAVIEGIRIKEGGTRLLQHIKNKG